MDKHVYQANTKDTNVSENSHYLGGDTRQLYCTLYFKLLLICGRVVFFPMW